MKNIYKYILAAAALMTGLTTFAQNLPDGVYIQDESGVAYRKSATLKEGTTDKYIIDLEAFVTGEVTIKDEAVPADIVLVLDVSGSMNDPTANSTYTARSSQSYSYNSYGDNAYYYLYNGQYYKVERYASGGWNNNYYLRFNTGNNNYRYLTGNTSTGSSYNAGEDYSSSTIYTGVLYTPDETKIQALRAATNAFIATIQENDEYDVKRDEDGNVISKTRRKNASGEDTTLGNQISIVKFAGDALNSTSDPTTGNTTYEYDFTIGGIHYSGTSQYTEVLARFLNVTDDYSTLTGIVDNLYALGGTSADYGTEKANLLFDWLEANYPKRESSRTVVFFTDGEPTHTTGFDQTVASTTIANAYTAKNDHDATVFTIGVFANLGNNATNVNNYMNYTSSNYPDARNWSQPGNPIAEAKRIYYQNASNADLTSIFTMVAQQSGGSGNTDVTAESAVTVDVIASSFSLPENVTAEDITVTVAPCTGQTTKTATQVGSQYAGTYLTFGEAKEATEYGLPAITPIVDASKNTVSTKGFDFSENYCAAIDDHGTITGGRGYKQIISFEITVNPDAVGGPNVVTNDEKSGIYLKDKTEPLVTFNRPTVEIPIQIWIKKKGLLGEDSAVFNIQYTNYVEGVDPRTIADNQWKSFDKVMVNSHSPKDKDGLPMEKLVGLNPHFFYRIKEDAWAWSYNYQDNGIQYTFGEDQVNPFIFENLPKETPKEAEATVRNTFNEKTTTESPVTGGDGK